MDRRNNKLIFIVHFLEMEERILVDFRLSKVKITSMLSFINCTMLLNELFTQLKLISRIFVWRIVYFILLIDLLIYSYYWFDNINVFSKPFFCVLGGRFGIQEDIHETKTEAVWHY